MIRKLVSSLLILAVIAASLPSRSEGATRSRQAHSPPDVRNEGLSRLARIVADPDLSIDIERRAWLFARAAELVGESEDPVGLRWDAARGLAVARVRHADRWLAAERPPAGALSESQQRRLSRLLERLQVADAGDSVESAAALREFFDSAESSAASVLDVRDGGSNAAILPATLAAPSRAVASRDSAIEHAPIRTPERAWRSARLPRSYGWYLAGVALYFIGEETSSILLPIYGFHANGLLFAAAIAGLELFSMVPGSFIGARLIRRFDSRRTYAFSNLLVGATLLSLPVANHFLGVVPNWLLLAYSAAFGFTYGATRGVAEQEIMPRIVGQTNRGRLRKAASQFFLAMELPSIVMPIAGVALLPMFGISLLTIVAAALMLMSAAPFFFIRFRTARASVLHGSGTEDRLPLKDYLPFLFFRFVYLALWYVFGLSVALQVFRDLTFFGELLGIFAAGSMVLGLLENHRPRWVAALSEKTWLTLGLIANVAMLWALVVTHLEPVCLALSFAAGLTATANWIQWPAIYKQRLKLARQPAVFQWLNAVAVLATLVPVGFVGYYLLGSALIPKATLIGIVAGISALAAAVQFVHRR